MKSSLAASVACFLLTLGLLAVVQLKVELPMLLAERAMTGGGWIEAFLLSAYAATITGKLHDIQASVVWRRRIWTMLSGVFFAQLVLGLAGMESFLMRPDRVHLPVPALIVAGPIFRGGGVFMLVLFIVTLLLVGSAWCSYICYLGSWDQLAAQRRGKPQSLWRWSGRLRLGLAVLVIGSAVSLRLAGVSVVVAGAAALGFGLVGVLVMLLWSRRRGAMIHCTVFCPIGLLANWLGRISPFRIRIGDGCDDCQLCRLSCRYGALDKQAIASRRPAITCSLCGDCLASCPGRHIEYRFPGLTPSSARALFIVMTTALHAATLGLARV